MKKSVKKLISLGMTAVLLTGILAGCGGEKTPAPAAEGTPAVEAENTQETESAQETAEAESPAAETEAAETSDELITPETAGNVKPNNQGYKVALCNFSLANTWRVEMQETFIL